MKVMYMQSTSVCHLPSGPSMYHSNQHLKNKTKKHTFQIDIVKVSNAQTKMQHREDSNYVRMLVEAKELSSENSSTRSHVNN